jgi:hypothetical protein
MDLERYGWTFKEKDLPAAKDWVYRTELPAFNPVNARMNGNATWSLIQNECMGTDSQARTDQLPEDMMSKIHRQLKLEEGEGTQGQDFNHFDIYLTMKRNSSTYICKMVSLICLVTILAFTVFALSSQNLIGGRMITLVVTFLSLITFHNRQDTEVPNISTITFMDYYLYTA